MGKTLIIQGADFSQVSVEKVDFYNSVIINTNVSPDGGGSVSGGGAYLEGDIITLVATPNRGYKFTQWSDGNTNSTRTITVGNHSETYTAIFSQASPGTIEWYRDARSYESSATRTQETTQLDYILSSDKLSNLHGETVNVVRFVPGSSNQTVKIYDIDFGENSIATEIGSHVITSEDIANGYVQVSISDHIVSGTNIGIGLAVGGTSGYKYEIIGGDEKMWIVQDGTPAKGTTGGRITAISVGYMY